MVKIFFIANMNCQCKRTARNCLSILQDGPIFESIQTKVCAKMMRFAGFLAIALQSKPGKAKLWSIWSLRGAPFYGANGSFVAFKFAPKNCPIENRLFSGISLRNATLIAEIYSSRRSQQYIHAEVGDCSRLLARWAILSKLCKLKLTRFRLIYYFSVL